MPGPASQTPVPEGEWGRIKTAVFQGRKIEAIKIFRDCTGAGLKESKEAVELLEIELRKSNPEKFTGNASASKSGGCGSAVVALCLLVWCCTVMWKW